MNSVPVSDSWLSRACENVSKGLPYVLDHALTADQIDSNNTKFGDKPTPAQVWGVGLLCVSLISVCAALGIGLMPLLSKRIYHRLLTYFVGLGVGSLSGSAVFHLLPQAFGLVNDDNHSYLLTAWIAIFGIYLFFFVDKLIKLWTEYRKHHASFHRTHQSSPDSTARDPEAEGENRSNLVLFSTKPNDTLAPNGYSGCLTVGDYDTVSAVSAKSLNAADQEKQAHGICAHEHDVVFKQGDSVIATVAWMIIFGDGLHNFIDGLSIGAAFSDSLMTGISVSVAVLCEEFPHELGDVAILLNAGMSLRQALTYNLLSAATCYLGFVLGVLLGELAEASTYVFALAGGMFLYISLASMIPEMNAALEKQMESSMWRSVVVLLVQAAGLLTGLFTMYIMARFGSQISF